MLCNTICCCCWFLFLFCFASLRHAVAWSSWHLFLCFHVCVCLFVFVLVFVPFWRFCFCFVEFLDLSLLLLFCCYQKRVRPSSEGTVSTVRKISWFLLYSLVLLCVFLPVVMFHDSVPQFVCATRWGCVFLASTFLTD